MIQGLLQRTLIILLVAGLIACGFDGVDIGPTSADLEEQPPLLEIANPDPQVTFQVDRQQGIDNFRALVEVTGDGGGSGDELRRLADFKRIPTGSYDVPTKKGLTILGEQMPFRCARVESNDV